jgi:hypothetical protein
MDWTIAGDLQLSDPTGHRITTLPEKTTSYSYTTDSWYLGVFAWVFTPRGNRLRNLHSRRFGSTGGPEVKGKFGAVCLFLFCGVCAPIAAWRWKNIWILLN